MNPGGSFTAPSRGYSIKTKTVRVSSGHVILALGSKDKKIYTYLISYPDLLKKFCQVKCHVETSCFILRKVAK